MKTAVEWLEEQLLKFHNWKLNPVFDENCFDEIELRKAIQQAKEMEKQYINDAHCHGYDYCRLRELDEQDNDLEFDYFQITFKHQEE